jgi:hypothetical protein
MEPDSSEPTSLEAALFICFVALFGIVIIAGIARALGLLP